MTAYARLLALHTPIHSCPHEVQGSKVTRIAETDFAADDPDYDPCPTYALLKEMQNLAKALIERVTKPHDPA